jgi:glycine/D-amino acid oxidase-like deaminating enzyme
MPKIFDVIVVGAGSVGTPTALFLAQEGLKVLVIEKNSSPGQGENKAAIGGVRATHSDPAKIMTSIDSLKIFSTWKEKYGSEIEWKTGGYCFPVYTEKLENQLKGFLPIQKKFGLEIDYVSIDKIKEIIPGINSEGLRGGSYSLNDGQVSPLMMATACEREAKQNGVVFKYNEKVVKYSIENGKIHGVVTDKDRYSSKYVVIATGATAKDDGKLLGIDIPVTPDAHEAGISAPVKPFLAPLVVDMRPGIYGKTANFYFGQAKSGQIIFCYTPKDLYVGQNHENISEFMPILANRLISLIPRFKNLIIRRIWRGLYPMTPDGIPIVDKVKEVEGVFLGVGMCGQGFMLGPGVGKNITSLILNDKSTLPAEVHKAFSFYRDFYIAKTEAFK